MKTSFLRPGLGVTFLAVLAVTNARAGQIASLDASDPSVVPDATVTMNYVAPITEGTGCAELTVPGAWTNALKIDAANVLQQLKQFQGAGKVLMDVSMAAPPAGWFQIHMSFQGDGLGWTQFNDVFGTGGAFNGTVELDFSQLNLASVPDNPTWGQMFVITNTGQPTTVKIDNIRVISPVPPKPSAVYTFDTGTESYGKPAASHSALFGGSLAVSPTVATWDWHTDRQNMGADMTAKLQAAALSGGTMSVDVFGSAGSLTGFNFSLFLQPWNTWTWTQVDAAVPFGAIESLPGGMEVARVKIPLASLGAGFTSQPGYNSGFGFERPVGTTIYFDNIMVTPSATTKIDFKTNASVFTEEGTSTVFQVGSIGGGALYMENLAGAVWGSKANFNAAASTEAAALYAKLVKASTAGGKLRFKVYEPFLLTKGANFSGVQVAVALNGTTWQQQYPLWIDDSDFTEGSLDTTPPGFVRTVEIPLYPAGSPETDGFVLAANAASYEFVLGTNLEHAASVGLYIDDFEVITAPDPSIIHLPTIPSAAGGIIGRVLTNVEGECTYGAQHLPPGVTINPDTGLVVGTPTADGTYEVIFSVTADAVTVSESATWVVTGSGTKIRVTSFSRTVSGATITWSGGPAAVNVERSTTMQPGSWTPISVGDTDGTHLDTTAPVGKAFYRVVAPN
ncbi:putative Ig domain-containing protein [Haloferula sp. BvORR071]|uniref:putative Ig domain-containing protein n=1 Tax=Haloferula sp. BvORR071 TaxID=1396141 RepID=UPI000556099A|nr:putative Ig domain-containing protein [Haloferula sp. BvORR071]